MTKFKSTSFKYLGRDLRRFTYEFQALQNFYTKPFSSLTLNWIVYFYFMLRAKEFQKFLEFSWFINSKTFNICTFQMNIFLFKISESGLKLFFAWWQTVVELIDVTSISRTTQIKVFRGSWTLPETFWACYFNI